MTTGHPDSNNTSKPRFDQDDLTRESQEAQVVQKINPVLFILHINSYFPSRKRDIWEKLKGSMRISHNGVYALYYGNHDL